MERVSTGEDRLDGSFEPRKELGVPTLLVEDVVRSSSLLRAYDRLGELLRRTRGNSKSSSQKASPFHSIRVFSQDADAGPDKSPERT